MQTFQYNKHLNYLEGLLLCKHFSPKLHSLKTLNKVPGIISVSTKKRETKTFYKQNLTSNKL